VRIVWSWLREFCPTEHAASELAERLTLHGVKVEEVLRPWEGVQDVVVSRIVKVEDHPASEKLTVVTVDDGTGEHVVCAGVRNYEAGDLVPWARPGARVPVLPEPLAPRDMGGVVSHGMLCSPRELGIADVHTGILVLDPGTVVPGEDLVAALGLDDEVLDIEVEPNRPDFLSVLGVAREVSALTGTPLVDRRPPLEESEEIAADVATIQIDALDGCPRYVARVIRGLGEGTTPIRAQARLTACGMRPISAVVDATNYAMLELGQPLHAFDLHRLAGPGIVVRRAAEGEPLRTLDGVDRTMTDGDLLICDVERPVAIAGVMGGATSEVNDDTVDVLLESACFTRTGVLRTARRLDLHTEASHRFERGTDPEGLEAGADRGAQLMAAWAGGSVARGLAEDGSAPPRRHVSIRPSRASALLAYDVPRSDVEGVFDRLRMTHDASGGDDGDGERVDVEVPGYRVDIEHEVDLIEEVARVLGYDRIGTHVPPTGQAGGVPAGYRFRSRAVEALVRSGLCEVRLMTFASADDLAMTGHTDGVPVANPLQADDAFLRTRLLPGLVHAVARNQARGVPDMAIFETGTVFRLDGEEVVERQHVAFALAGMAGEHWDVEPRPFDALDATGVLEALLTTLAVRNRRLGDPPGMPFHPGRAATVLVGDAPVGVVGELHPRVARDRGVEGRIAACELVLDSLLPVAAGSVVVTEPPRFPPVRRDLAFVVADDVAAGEVRAAIEGAAGDLLGRCVLFDVFRGAPLDRGTKSLAFAVELRALDRTLTREDTDPVVNAIVERVEREFEAKLRAG
jgi:phenylalanyl-tRNA synthetase beta chain